MITISILTLRNATPASVDDSCYVFKTVNRFLAAKNKPGLFNVQLVGIPDQVIYNDGTFIIHPEKNLKEAGNAELIIIPVLTGSMIQSIQLNKEYIDWIIKQYKSGAEIAALSTGVFMLAFAGLLKGRQCTTHWQYSNELKHFYPSIEVVDERVITDQNGLYSIGRSNDYWNLLLHLVEKYAGRELAIYTAKYFSIDIDRNFQSPFIIFNGLKDHTDEQIKEIQTYIEKNYKDKITVDQLAEKFNITRRTIERRFKKATRNTIAEYIQRVKMEAAKKQLETGRKSINEIMMDIGYMDTQTFRDIFKRITGMTPVEYKGKYSKR